MSDAAGIYVHLPYCRSRCGYCSFVVTTDDSSRSAYFGALVSEIRLAAAEAERQTFDSVYLGGGTPSLTPHEELEALLASLRDAFRLEASSEITLEANPDDVTLELARRWRAMGINRVSLGVQSLSDQELAAVGRRHDADGARRALETLGRSGFSVSADLILGLPDQTRDSFRRSYRELGETGIDHISVYLLETEKSRVIEGDRRSRPERYLSDDEQADAWLELAAWLAGRGFVHYEISNWARDGLEARHNLKYWERRPTLGLGVSAHELWDERRRANPSGIPQYVGSIAGGRRASALDRPLDAVEREREGIVLGLRLSRGVPATNVEAWIDRSPDPLLRGDYHGWLAEGWLAAADGRLRLTERGFLVSNEILCRFA